MSLATRARRCRCIRTHFPRCLSCRPVEDRFRRRFIRPHAPPVSTRPLPPAPLDCIDHRWGEEERERERGREGGMHATKTTGHSSASCRHVNSESRSRRDRTCSVHGSRVRFRTRLRQFETKPPSPSSPLPHSSPLPQRNAVQSHPRETVCCQRSCSVSFPLAAPFSDVGAGIKR